MLRNLVSQARRLRASQSLEIRSRVGLTPGIALSCALATSCAQAPSPSATPPTPSAEDNEIALTVLPRPLLATARPGAWVVPCREPLVLRAEAELHSTASLLMVELRALGLDAQAADAQAADGQVADGQVAGARAAGAPSADAQTTPAQRAHIELTLDAEIGGAEAYQLEVSAQGAIVRGSTPAGVFYGVQTLLQVARPALRNQPDLSNGADENAGCPRLPALYVEDAPRFGYRGLMLDVSRHFQPVEVIKRVIDRMAEYKLNRFHWHLTDDQGWRIEIKKYPRLVEVGSSRPRTRVGHGRLSPEQYDDAPHGGFYTQEQIREVVAYAAQRHVTVVPEIELPGHSSAALAAYPVLGCHPGPFEVATTWGIFEDVYCPHPETFRFLEDVLEEVLTLFPGPYIHVGGDEVLKQQWRSNAAAQELMRREQLRDEESLQSYFVTHFVQFLQQRGRRAIGWDEILEGGLPRGAIVMSWRGEEGGIAAARLGHDVVMSPQSHLYLDHYQGRPVEEEPLAIGGYSPLEKVYDYDPIASVLDATAARHVLGAQANLWTEYVPTLEQLEYMLFPRLFALAEVTWTARHLRDYGDFERRLGAHFARLDELGSNYAPHHFLPRFSVRPRAGGALEVALTSPSGHPVLFTSDGAVPTEHSPRYTEPLLLQTRTTVTAATLLRPSTLSPARRHTYWVNLATGRPVHYFSPPDPRYAPEGALTDALFGTTHAQDGRWVGVLGSDLKFAVDLGDSIEVASSDVGFLLDPSSWVLLPERVEILLSEDGVRYQHAGWARPCTAAVAEPRRQIFSLRWGPRRARFVQVHARNAGSLPAGHPGQGSPSWLFADELLVDRTPAPACSSDFVVTVDR